ncbi:MAG: TolC family protein, partial [Fusobacteriaceae bacterium]
NQVLEEVKKNNYNIKVAKKNMDIVKIEEKKAFKGLFPTVDLTLTNDLLSNDNKGLDVLKPQQISAPVTIYSGGRRVNNYKARKIDSNIAVRDITITEQEEEIRATEFYFQILNLQKQLKITDATKKSLKNQEKRLDILFSKGKMISKNELLEIKADIKSIDAQTLRFKNEMKSNKEKLAQLIGFDGEIEVTEYEKIFADKNIDGDRERLSKSSSIVKKTELEIEKARLDVKNAKAEFLPTVTITPSYNIDSDSTDGSANSSGEDKCEIGLNDSINLFQWGATIDEIKSKKTSLELREMQQKDTLQTLKIDLNDRYREIALLNEEVKIAKERVDILNENIRIQNIRFTNGLISSLDYLESVRRLRGAEEESYSLQKSLILANRNYENLLK